MTGLPIRRSSPTGDDGHVHFAETCDPEALAAQLWAVGHGLTMLVVTGVLPREALVVHAPATATALFVAAGDHEDRCRRVARARFGPTGRTG